MNLTPVDWTIAAIAGVSIGLGLWRGFMREVLSLAGWVAGLWLALLHAVPLGERFPFDLPWPAARTGRSAKTMTLLLTPVSVSLPSASVAPSALMTPSEATGAGWVSWPMVLASG